MELVESILDNPFKGIGKPGHWFSLIKRGKNYWVKVRETKKQI